MILQPLIENAIRHNIFAMDKPVEISIRCSKEDEDLVLVVSDNRIGISPFKLQEVRDHSGSGNGKSVGLNNVHSRIVLYFGQAYGLSIDSPPGSGTSARLAGMYPADYR